MLSKRSLHFARARARANECFAKISRSPIRCVLVNPSRPSQPRVTRLFPRVCERTAHISDEFYAAFNQSAPDCEKSCAHLSSRSRNCSIIFWAVNFRRIDVASIESTPIGFFSCVSEMTGLFHDRALDATLIRRYSYRVRLLNFLPFNRNRIRVAIIRLQYRFP